MLNIAEPNYYAGALYPPCPRWDSKALELIIRLRKEVMRRLGQAASPSQVLRCQGCSGVEKAILATTTP